MNCLFSIAPFLFNLSFIFREVESLASDFLRDPIHVTIGSLDLAANHNIRQIVEILDERQKGAK